MGKWISIRNKKKNAFTTRRPLFAFRDKGFAKTLSLMSFQILSLAKGLSYILRIKIWLRDKLIAHKAGQLFADAHHALTGSKFLSFEDQIVAVCRLPSSAA